MSAAIPTTEPFQVRAGDTLKWTKTYSDYSALDGWALTYRLMNSSTKIDIGGGLVTTTGSQFNIAVDAATSKTWAAGKYRWQAVVTKGLERYTVGEGRITVLEDLSNAGGAIDDRTQNERILEAIDAAIEGRSSNDIQEYTIGTRSVKRMVIADLLKWHAVYAARVRTERRDRGEVLPSRIVGVRFGNAS